MIPRANAAGKIGTWASCRALLLRRLLRGAGLVTRQSVHATLIRTWSLVWGLGLPRRSRSWAGFIAWKSLYARPAGAVATSGLRKRRSQSDQEKCFPHDDFPLFGRATHSQRKFAACGISVRTRATLIFSALFQDTASSGSGTHSSPFKTGRQRTRRRPSETRMAIQRVYITSGSSLMRGASCGQKQGLYGQTPRGR